ncbi:MAG TPA: copper chaperone PCu(A)C [Gallionellaceae bacterium]
MKLSNMLFILTLALSGSAWADNKDASKDTSKDVVVRNAWITETAPGQTKASVQMEITCVSSIGKLVGIESPVAESVEMQRLRPSHGRMAVETLTAVAMRHNHPMSFGPRTQSIVLLGLKQPLKAGDLVPLKLTVNTAGKKVEVEVKAKVKPAEQPASTAAPAQSGVAAAQSGVAPAQSGVAPAQPAAK